MISAFLPGEEEQQIEHYRHLPAEKKFKEIAVLNRLQAERQRADIRARYGDIPESEIQMHLGVLRLGRETMARVFGWDPDTATGQSTPRTADELPS